MKTRFVAFLAVTVGILLISAPLFAHHGRVGYDNEKVLLTLKATVTALRVVEIRTCRYTLMRPTRRA